PSPRRRLALIERQPSVRYMQVELAQRRQDQQAGSGKQATPPQRFSTSTARKLLTLVSVGPVRRRSPMWFVDDFSIALLP
ncbi:hypothetical protein, partial [Methyloceanibacter sp.]|uniref:hypothetical protein n=1 Tax=Methyloceanibacter sp. TaxID=1965321 RepID=UPI003D6C97E3